MPLLEVNDVRFAYGSSEVLRGISMAADSNEIISVLGPNGVGKTTLLKCVCNMLNPTAGYVRVCDRVLSDIPSRNLAKLVGYVPQKAETTRSTVFDSVLIGRRPHMSITFSDRDIEIAWAAIESIGLEEKSLDYVNEISGGEFQKVQIARAITQEPKLLILDEPSNNLDIANSHRTMRLIKRMVRERGLCTIMTMHDINLATYYSDKFLFIKDGAVIAFGDQSTITPEMIKTVYGIDTDVIAHDGRPVVIPKADQDTLDESP